jgi:hypothetical protein
MLVLEWWHVLVFLAVTGAFINWYGKKTWKIGYYDGIPYGVKHGQALLLDHLIELKYLKCVDPYAVVPEFVEWPDETKPKLLNEESK